MGDLKFGHLTYIVLKGILLPDLYPDPDVVCKFLNADQLRRVEWFNEWIIKSLEGVEVQENTARAALTRSQIICSLRYRDERYKLSKIPPQWIVLSSRMIGSWPFITFGGCRFVLQAWTWFMNQLRMLQRLVIQWLSDNMESDMTYKILDEILGQELWIS